MSQLEIKNILDESGTNNSKVMKNDNISPGNTTIDRSEIYLKAAKQNTEQLNKKSVGHLELRFGPMMSGKSHWLMSHLSIYAHIGLNVLYINSNLDNRSATQFSTHNNSFTGIDPLITASKAKTLQELDVSKFDIIGVDECQFFPDLYDVVKLWIDVLGKKVYCAGLDGDSQRQTFGQIILLIPLADSAEKMSAKCQKCWQQFGGNTLVNAPFTHRNVKSEEQVLIGGKNLYTPLCRYHYLKDS